MGQFYKSNVTIPIPFRGASLGRRLKACSSSWARPAAAAPSPGRSGARSASSCPSSSASWWPILRPGGRGPETAVRLELGGALGWGRPEAAVGLELGGWPLLGWPLLGGWLEGDGRTERRPPRGTARGPPRGPARGPPGRLPGRSPCGHPGWLPGRSPCGLPGGPLGRGREVRDHERRSPGRSPGRSARGPPGGPPGRPPRRGPGSWGPGSRIRGGDGGGDGRGSEGRIRHAHLDALPAAKAGAAERGVALVLGAALHGALLGKGADAAGRHGQLRLGRRGGRWRAGSRGAGRGRAGRYDHQGRPARRRGGVRGGSAPIPIPSRAGHRRREGGVTGDARQQVPYRIDGGARGGCRRRHSAGPGPEPGRAQRQAQAEGQTYDDQDRNRNGGPQEPPLPHHGHASARQSLPRPIHPLALLLRHVRGISDQAGLHDDGAGDAAIPPRA